jgi:hypothetical protein
MPISMCRCTQGPEVRGLLLGGQVIPIQSPAFRHMTCLTIVHQNHDSSDPTAPSDGTPIVLLSRRHLSYGSVTRASHSSRAAIEAPFVQGWFPPQRQEMLLGTSTDTAVHGVVIDTKAIERCLPKRQYREDSEGHDDSFTSVPFEYTEASSDCRPPPVNDNSCVPIQTPHLATSITSARRLNDPRNLHHSWDWTVTISETSRY